MSQLRTQPSPDSELHRRRLREYIDDIKQESDATGRNYELFFQQLLSIFGDDPPLTWRFFQTDAAKYPVFRVIKRSSGRSNDFLRLCGDLLIIHSQFFDEKYRTLFPKRNDFFGQGDSVILDFASFAVDKQRPYLEAIRDLVTNSNKCHINFSVHHTR